MTLLLLLLRLLDADLDVVFVVVVVDFLVVVGVFAVEDCFLLEDEDEEDMNEEDNLLVVLVVVVVEEELVLVVVVGVFDVDVVVVDVVAPLNMRAKLTAESERSLIRVNVRRCVVVATGALVVAGDDSSSC